MKTITLGWEGNPEFSLARGHINAEEFSRRFLAEGWSEKGVGDDQISHEYWIEKPNGDWKQSSKKAKTAKPVTVMRW